MSVNKFLEVQFRKGISSSPYKFLLPMNIRIITFGGFTTDYSLTYEKCDKEVEHLLQKYTINTIGLEINKPIKVVYDEPFVSSFTKFKIYPLYLSSKGDWVKESEPQSHYGSLPILEMYPIHNTICDVYRMIR